METLLDPHVTGEDSKEPSQGPDERSARQSKNLNALNITSLHRNSTVSFMPKQSHVSFFLTYVDNVCAYIKQLFDHPGA
mgnify:FL=1